MEIKHRVVGQNEHGIWVVRHSLRQLPDDPRFQDDSREQLGYCQLTHKDLLHTDPNPERIADLVYEHASRWHERHPTTGEAYATKTQIGEPYLHEDSRITPLSDLKGAVIGGLKRIGKGGFGVRFSGTYRKMFVGFYPEEYVWWEGGCILGHIKPEPGKFLVEYLFDKDRRMIPHTYPDEVALLNKLSMHTPNRGRDEKL